MAGVGGEKIPRDFPPAAAHRRVFFLVAAFEARAASPIWFPFPLDHPAAGQAEPGE